MLRENNLLKLHELIESEAKVTLSNGPNEIWRNTLSRKGYKYSPDQLNRGRRPGSIPTLQIVSWQQIADLSAIPSSELNSCLFEHSRVGDPWLDLQVSNEYRKSVCSQALVPIKLSALFYSLLSDETEVGILEVGAGIGLLALYSTHTFLDGFKKRKFRYFIVDLPETLQLSYWTLSGEFEERSHLIVSSETTAAEIEGADFIYVSIGFIEKIPRNSVHICVNCNSFAEMSSTAVRTYLVLFDRVLTKGGYLYTSNMFNAGSDGYRFPCYIPSVSRAYKLFKLGFTSAFEYSSPNYIFFDLLLRKDEVEDSLPFDPTLELTCKLVYFLHASSLLGIEQIGSYLNIDFSATGQIDTSRLPDRILTILSREFSPVLSTTVRDYVNGEKSYPFFRGLPSSLLGHRSSLRLMPNASLRGGALFNQQRDALSRSFQFRCINDWLNNDNSFDLRLLKEDFLRTFTLGSISSLWEPMMSDFYAFWILSSARLFFGSEATLQGIYSYTQRSSGVVWRLRFLKLANDLGDRGLARSLFHELDAINIEPSFLPMFIVEAHLNGAYDLRDSIITAACNRISDDDDRLVPSLIHALLVVGFSQSIIDKIRRFDAHLDINHLKSNHQRLDSLIRLAEAFVSNGVTAPERMTAVLREVSKDDFFAADFFSLYRINKIIATGRDLILHETERWALKNSQSFYSLAKVASIYAVEGEVERALDCAEASIRLRVTPAKHYDFLGRVFFNIDEFDTAHRFFFTGFGLAPEDVVLGGYAATTNLLKGGGELKGISRKVLRDSTEMLFRRSHDSLYPFGPPPR